MKLELNNLTKITLDTALKYLAEGELGYEFRYLDSDVLRFGYEYLPEEDFILAIKNGQIRLVTEQYSFGTINRTINRARLDTPEAKQERMRLAKEQEEKEEKIRKNREQVWQSGRTKTLGERTTNGIPIRLEIASRILAGFASNPFLAETSGKDGNISASLEWADLLLEAYVKNISELDQSRHKDTD